MIGKLAKRLPFWALPIAVAAVAFVVVFAVRSTADDRYEHTTTLVTSNDGRTGPWDNRNAMVEHLRAEIDRLEADVNLVLRFNNVVDVVTSAGNQAEATALATQLAEFAVAERLEAAGALDRADLASLDIKVTEAVDAVDEAAASLDAFDDRTSAAAIEAVEVFRTAVTAREILERERTLAEARLDGVVSPAEIVRSEPQGRESPEPARDAALAAAVAAIVVLALMVATSRSSA